MYPQLERYRTNKKDELRFHLGDLILHIMEIKNRPWWNKKNGTTDLYLIYLEKN